MTSHVTRRCLIVVAKEPVAGLVKTRLMAGIGPEHTVALYNAFLEDTITLAQQLSDCQLAFSFWPETAAGHFRQHAPDALLLPQSGDDFGARLLSAFTQASRNGYDAMVLIGSDNPGLPIEYIEQAFRSLAMHDTVLGPADDGGYYLIGMRTPQPALFHQGIAWSTSAVAEQTHVSAKSAGLGMGVVGTWYDIDTADDLRRLYRDLCSRRSGAYAPATLACLSRLAQNGLSDLLS